MITVTLAELRRSSELAESAEVILVSDGRKRKEVGYFIPISLAGEFRRFLDEAERRRKRAKLRRVARAQAADPIEEGGVDDGLAQG
jgi:hypothetical protein